MHRINQGSEEGEGDFFSSLAGTVSARSSQVPRKKKRENEQFDCVEEFLNSSQYEEWAASLSVGDCIDCIDSKFKWYPSYILSIEQNPLQFYVHYQGWNSKWDEWFVFSVFINSHVFRIHLSSKRVAPLGTHIYDVIFRDEIKERPSAKYRINPIDGLKSRSYDNEMINNLRNLIYDKSFVDVNIIFPRPSSGGRTQTMTGHHGIFESRCPGIFDFLVDSDDELKDPDSSVDSESIMSSVHQYICRVPFGIVSYIREFCYTGGSAALNSSDVENVILATLAFRAFAYLEFLLTTVSITDALIYLEISHRMIRFIEHGEYTADLRPGSFQCGLLSNIQGDPRSAQALDSLQALKQHCLEVFRENASDMVNSLCIRTQMKRLTSELLIEIISSLAPFVGYEGSKRSSRSRKRRRHLEHASIWIDPAEVDDVRDGRSRAVAAIISEAEEALEEIILAEEERERENPLECKQESERKVPSVADDIFFQSTPQLVRYQQDMDNLFQNRGTMSCNMGIELESGFQYAHQCILAAQSSFFELLIKSEMKDRDRVSLRGLFKYTESFEAILRYMYSGYVGTYSIEIASDILCAISFFDLKSNVLKRACESVILFKCSPKDFVPLMNMCFYRLKDENLFSQVVKNMSLLSSRESVVQQIKDVQILQLVVKVLFPNKDEVNDEESIYSNPDYDNSPSEDQSAIFILSDALSRLLQNRRQSTLEHVIMSMEPYMSSMDPFNRNSPFKFDEITSAVTGSTQFFTQRTGHLCSLLSRHLIRVRIR